jgi:hypothetical protein
MAVSGVNRIVREDTYSLQVPVAANIQISRGDFVFKTAAGYAVPASGGGWSVSAEGSNAIIKSGFLGIAQEDHNSTDPASKILVATEGIARLQVSGQFNPTGVGEKIHLVKDAGGNYLSNQLVSLASSSGTGIGVLAQTVTSAVADGGTILVRFWGKPAIDITQI